MVIVTTEATVGLLGRSAKGEALPHDESCVCSKSNYHWKNLNVEFSKKSGISDHFLFGSLEEIMVCGCGKAQCLNITRSHHYQSDELNIGGTAMLWTGGNFF